MSRARLHHETLNLLLGSAALGCLALLVASCGGTGGSGDGSGGGAAASGGAQSGSGGAASGTGGALPVGTGGSGGGVSGGAPGSGGAPATGGGESSGGAAATGGSGGGSGGGVAADATYVPDPSWSCGHSEGIVAPELGTLVFTATLDVADVHDVGETHYGQRKVLSLAGGSIEGELEGVFLNGGLDFALTLANGTVELEHVDLIEADDGTRIYMRTCGMAPAGADGVRFVPDFEAPNSSSLAWLNTGDFVGIRRVDASASTLTLEVYDVAEAEPGQDDIVFADPAEVPDQPWECNLQDGNQGPSVFTETVLISGSLSIGASKYGTRNAIPITGGTVSGGFVGTVVPAGADFQLTSGGTTTLDARYLLESSEGEFLVVRNCGPFGALLPWFEARADGPYAHLNEGSYLSSDPGSAQGGVSITFYERQ